MSPNCSLRSERYATAEIKCQECNAEVGTTDEKCPNCGNQIIKSQGIDPGTLAIAVLVVVALIGLWFWKGGA
jgi:primosomal protein N'